jgi:hypothetical protein
MKNKLVTAFAAMFSLVILACGGSGEIADPAFNRRYIIWNVLPTGSPAVKAALDNKGILQDDASPRQQLNGQVGAPTQRSMQYPTGAGVPIALLRSDTGATIFSGTTNLDRSDRQVIIPYGTVAAPKLLILPFKVSRQEEGKRVQLTVAHTLNPAEVAGTPGIIDVHVTSVGGTPSVATRVLAEIYHTPLNPSGFSYNFVNANFNGNQEVVLTNSGTLVPWLRIPVNFINGNHYFVAVGKDGATARAYEFHQAYGSPAP